MLDSSRFLDCVLSNYFASIVSLWISLVIDVYFMYFIWDLLLGCFVSGYLSNNMFSPNFYGAEVSGSEDRIFIVLLPVQSEICCLTSPGSPRYCDLAVSCISYWNTTIRHRRESMVRLASRHVRGIVSRRDSLCSIVLAKELCRSSSVYVVHAKRL